ncbi:hypothetical protein PMIN03_011753 [Paraphaeosphaeria minitans]
MNESNGTLMVEPVSEEDKRIMRMDLGISLYGELCHEDDESHDKLPDANSMLVASKRLDKIIQTLRRQDEDKLRIALGDSFEHATRILDGWLSWREGCWILSDATGVSLLLTWSRTLMKLVRYTLSAANRPRASRWNNGRTCSVGEKSVALSIEHF